MKSIIFVALFGSFLSGVEGLAAKSPPPRTVSVPAQTQSVSDSPIVPLSVEQDGDSSRRLFLTSVVGLGLLASIEPAHAVDIVLDDPKQKD